MADRAHIIIHCQQDGTPSTYNYTQSTGWHTEHVGPEDSLTLTCIQQVSVSILGLDSTHLYADLSRYFLFPPEIFRDCTDYRSKITSLNIISSQLFTPIRALYVVQV